MSSQFDFIVIGAGSGGVRAARIAAQLGAKVAIIEGRFFGGTCVNVGCVPKKLFSYGAAMPGQAALAENYGFADAQMGQHDWLTLKQHKDTEIERLNEIYVSLLENAGVTIFEGYGKVLGQGQVQVNDQVLEAPHILIATGGKPWIPDIEGKEHIRISDDLFSMTQLPKRVVVVGGGYIATEFASILNGFGSETSLLYRGDLFLRGFDHDVREFVAQEMSHRGVKLTFSTDITRIEEHSSCLLLHLNNGETIETDAVFYATGRVPNLDDLFAEQMPLLDERGAIKVDDTFQTNIEGLYAVGDVIDRVQLTPVALAEGMWLAHKLFAKGDPGLPPAYDLIPTAVFTHPNIGTVGLSQQQALEEFKQVRVYRSDFRALKYTLGDINHRSFMKLVVDDATDRVLGLHMVGDDAGEIVQGFAVALKMGATKADFDRTVGIHPTSAEEFVTMRNFELVCAE